MARPSASARGRPPQRRPPLKNSASLRTFHLADALTSAPMFLCLLPTSLVPRERRVPRPFPQRCGTWAEAPCRCFRPFFFLSTVTVVLRARERLARWAHRLRVPLSGRVADRQVPAPRHISR